MCLHRVSKISSPDSLPYTTSSAYRILDSWVLSMMNSFHSLKRLLGSLIVNTFSGGCYVYIA